MKPKVVLKQIKIEGDLVDQLAEIEEKLCDYSVETEHYKEMEDEYEKTVKTLLIYYSICKSDKAIDKNRNCEQKSKPV